MPSAGMGDFNTRRDGDDSSGIEGEGNGMEDRDVNSSEGEVDEAEVEAQIERTKN